MTNATVLAGTNALHQSTPGAAVAPTRKVKTRCEELNREGVEAADLLRLVPYARTMKTIIDHLGAGEASAAELRPLSSVFDDQALDASRKRTSEKKPVKKPDKESRMVQRQWLVMFRKQSIPFREALCSTWRYFDIDICFLWQSILFDAPSNQKCIQIYFFM